MKNEKNISAAVQEMMAAIPAQPRQPIGHVLKTWPDVFGLVAMDAMRFQTRKDDRDFAPGDTVVFVEYDPASGQHTGRSTTRSIGLVVRGEFMPKGWCSFTLEHGVADSMPQMAGRVR